MLDFLRISTRLTKNGTEIYPTFRTYPKSQDLMIRGGDFYAIWNEETGLWSTNEDDAKYLIDKALDEYKKEHGNEHYNPIIKYMWDSESGSIDKWHRFCQKQLRDSFEMLDQDLVFSNSEINKKGFSSKRLSYPLERGNISAYEKLISTLYSEEERHKIEWVIGSIVTGDSKFIQKFMVLYGEGGTGKSTILNIIQQLFDGYYAVFNAKALGSASNQFALEPFKKNPLVALEHDADLSRIEDNTRLNSVVSHERMTINEKHAKLYENSFNAFLIMGSNSPVKITDAKSGIIRRLIDVTPTGNKLSVREYNTIMNQIQFELGGIAYHCKEVYLEDPEYYNNYIPINMMGATNDFYNFMMDSYTVFEKEDGTTLKAAWEMYKVYCDETKVPYPMSRRIFQEELKAYFNNFNENFKVNGCRVRSYYSGLRTDRFEMNPIKKPVSIVKESWLKFNCDKSIFDEVYKDCPAQYANSAGTPNEAWDNVKSVLNELDTRELHYVRPPEYNIVIDFDIKDEDGNKCLEKNLEEASKWPPTYAELSKSGGGIHLHYNYTGDVSKLSRVYSDYIEVKVFTGKSSLRRKLSKCNDLPIAAINSGLPLKEERKMVSDKTIKSERKLREMIKRNLDKEFHGSTTCSIHFIEQILNDAYNSGVSYDLSDMYGALFTFAMNSTNQAQHCVDVVNELKLKSDETSTPVDNEGPIIFYDVEVFPNLFLVNWKIAGKGKPVNRMINPKPAEIEMLLKYRLIGFNCRRYDNHLIYAAYMGYTNEELFNLSQKIINGDKNAFFGEAYNLSYTDVYDYSVKKQSLKKWEIELGIKHHELGLPWDQPVPKERWVEVAEYCDDDVIATEEVHEHCEADFTARLILADLADGIPNDTTNSLTTKFIFGNERKPQSHFNYRDLGKPVRELDEEVIEFLRDSCPEMMNVFHGGEGNILPLHPMPGEEGSILPYFKGYKYENGVSTYRGEEIGEGGYVYAEPGMYTNVALLDIASMHPHSLIAECLFGVEFTKAFKEIVDGRVNIKHKAWDIVNRMLGGKLTKYVQKVINGELSAKDLANALKIAINSVYGLTSAKFDNPFRDLRNVDNIVAKRGALFMVDLKYEVQKRGFTVAHIKTDSIKIPNATPEIIEFVMEFGKRYGYTFEHEATYEKMCLVNDAVYIAKYKDGDWTATGKQFAVPYIFKTLFSKEPIKFEDLCETFSVKSALYLDMNEALPDVSHEEKELDKLEKQYKEGKISDMMLNEGCSVLNEQIEKGHSYHFIGKVGCFCPIKPGCGGGLLMRDQNGKYYAATGTKGYRWLEADKVRELKLEDAIDKSYYTNLVDDAVDAISKYGDFEWFVSDEPKWDFMNIPDNSPELVPFK